MPSSLGNYFAAWHPAGAKRQAERRLRFAPGGNLQPPKPHILFLLRTDIVTKQQFLIAQVESAVGDHRMRPDASLLTRFPRLRDLGFLRNLESALLLPGFGIGL